MRTQIAIFSILCLAVACSSGGSGKTVKDQAGRTCTVPDTGLTLSCDKTPMPMNGCSGGSTPCFVQGVASSTTSTIGPSAVCAACCSGNSATSGANDCSQITCTALNDCPQGSTKCESGGCY
jgi:hypothetical protein